MENLMGALPRTDLTTILLNIERGRSRTSEASRMRFFATTVSGWESLAVVTKKSILVPKGVLD